MTKTDINVVIVIPAFNEAKVIAKTIKDTIKCGYSNVLVIDDGSADDTAKKATDAGAMVVSHKINRGKGAATKTGIETAKLLAADIVVTLDGDGQHCPSDIQNLISPIAEGHCDVVLGTRLKKKKHQMPMTKVASNYVANFVTWSFFGLWVSDSQSGFRAYSRSALDCISTSADAYDYESEIIREIHHHRLVYKEVPISVQYTDYSMSKPHRQDMANGMKTLYKIFWKAISF
jgi:glycosyltransferase involved in cell wall biosynthesis